MSKGSVGFLTMLVVLFAVAFLLPQVGRGSGRRRSIPGLVYDTATEVTVSGTVVDVQSNQEIPRWTMCPTGCKGTHLLLKAGTATMMIDVGPGPYLESENFSVFAGDELTITGSKVRYLGSDFLVAKKIKKGDQVLTLRDREGYRHGGGLESE